MLQQMVLEARLCQFIVTRSSYKSSLLNWLLFHIAPCTLARYIAKHVKYSKGKPVKTTSRGNTEYYIIWLWSTEAGTEFHQQKTIVLLPNVLDTSDTWQKVTMKSCRKTDWLYKLKPVLTYTLTVTSYSHLVWWPSVNNWRRNAVEAHCYVINNQ